MRRLFAILMVLLCLCSCKDKASVFVLEGNVQRLLRDSIWHTDSVYTDTVYIYGADESFERVDTVIATNGMFYYTIEVDTVTPLWLHFPNHHREILFADKQLTVTVQGDTAATGHLHIIGGEQNRLMQDFYKRIVGMDSPKEIVQIADSFIRANPYAEACIPLLFEYFVNQPSPDNVRIKTLIGTMSGNLQDNVAIRRLKRDLDAQKPLVRNNLVQNYSVKDADGNYVSVSDYKDVYLLITFWASWDRESRDRQRELVSLKEKYKGRNFDILSISLDTDSLMWWQAIAEDSVTWRQANDFDGWRTGIVQRLQIQHLPANLLLNPNRRIQAIDLYGEELDKKIGEITEKKKSQKAKVKKSPANIRMLSK